MKAEDEHRRVRGMLDGVSGDGVPRLDVWRPSRHVAFGRRDEREPGYSDAVDVARQHGLDVATRTAGGRAVVHLGDTLAFAVALTGVDGVRHRYCKASDALQDALRAVGVETECREPRSSFCPGEHSLSASGGKLAGVAQRVKRDAALVSGVVLVDGLRDTVRVLDDVYSALDVEFDPASVSTAADETDVDVDALATEVRRSMLDEFDVDSG
ncbi:MAG: lipoyl protein ligase domain-containing protein [Halobacteriales archaeon]